jgi:hypothetical protein
MPPSVTIGRPSSCGKVCAFTLPPPKTYQGAFILARSMNDAGHMRTQLRVLRQLLEVLLEPRPAPR